MVVGRAAHVSDGAGSGHRQLGGLVKGCLTGRVGRQEGYVDTIAVLRAYRRRGLGTALLAQSLHALAQAGMEAAALDADAENTTGAVRIYERLGFRVRKTGIAYQKVMREG